MWSCVPSSHPVEMACLKKSTYNSCLCCQKICNYPIIQLVVLRRFETFSSFFFFSSSANIKNRSTIHSMGFFSFFTLRCTIKTKFFFHHTTCESTWDTLSSSATNQGDNTVSVARGGSATPGTTKQLLPPDRVFKRNIYLYIHQMN